MMKTMENFSLGMVRKFPGRFLALVLGISMFSTTYADELHDVFSPFADLLASDVADGDVNYPAFSESACFAEMMKQLASTAPAKDADQATRLAFYINAYNATSIQGILDGFSPSTIWGRLRFFKLAAISGSSTYRAR